MHFKKLLLVAYTSLLVLTPIQFTIPVLAQQQVQQIVMFNKKTHKYHDPGCRWAARCTVNCIALSKTEAIRRGGIPCKVCGG
jgi:hypothetical protein